MDGQVQTMKREKQRDGPKNIGNITRLDFPEKKKKMIKVLLINILK